jgi:hypothetical protein
VSLLVAVLIGLALGLVARAVVPGRALQGWSLLPAIGGSAASIVCVALTWAGVRPDALVVLVAAVAALLSVAAAGVLIGRSRRRADDALFAAVAKGGAAVPARPERA